jgi:hypothetical protein
MGVKTLEIVKEEGIFGTLSAQEAGMRLAEKRISEVGRLRMRR